MVIRISKRYASQAAANGKPKSGKIPKHLRISPEEEVKMIRRRMDKAERDERVDLTAALTAVRSYMPGFTRPRDLKIFKWLPGGFYITEQKKYASPPSTAYESYTVFLLESRYFVSRGVGMTTEHFHYTGLCQTRQLLKVLRQFNSPLCPGELKTHMDNAYWPWMKRLHNSLRKAKWWGVGEDPKEIMAEIEKRFVEGVKNPGGFIEHEIPKAGDDADPDEDADGLIGAGKGAPETRLRQKDASRNKRASNAEATKSVAELKQRTTAPPISKSSKSSQGTPVGLVEFATHGYPSDTYLNPPSCSSHPPPKSKSLPSRPQGTLSPNPLRDRYYPIISESPFWRPLILVTFPTRPLAATIARLSKAHDRGLAYHAAIDNEDKKSPLSFSARIRCMRLTRMRNLIRATAEGLEGFRGGFLGMRWKPEQRGRGVLGEGFEKPLPGDVRKVKVGIAKWYPASGEEFEMYRNIGEVLGRDVEGLRGEGDGEEGEGEGGKKVRPIEVKYVDDWGRTLNAEGLPEAGQELEEATDVYTEVEEDEAADELEMEATTDENVETNSAQGKNKRKPPTPPLSEEKLIELARKQAELKRNRHEYGSKKVRTSPHHP